MIDYGIVIVMMPLVLVGSFVGVLVNIMLPPILLSSILTVILLLLTAQSFFKGRQIYKKETQAQKQKQLEMATQQQLNRPISPPGSNLNQYNEFQNETVGDEGGDNVPDLMPVTRAEVFSAQNTHRHRRKLTMPEIAELEL